MSEHRRDQIPDIAKLRLAELPAMLRAERARRDLSLRAAAGQIGIGFSTLTRCEQGQMPELYNFLAMAAWLQVSVGWFLGEDGVAKQDAYRRGWDDCAASVRAVLGATQCPAAEEAQHSEPDRSEI